MGRRPRSSGQSAVLVGRGRRVTPMDLAMAGVLWRSGIAQLVLVAQAARSHPVAAFGLATFAVVWVQSGSGLVALAATPLLFGAGIAAWFVYRFRTTGVTPREASARLARERRVRAQWHRACVAADLPEVPPLTPWSVRSDAESVTVTIDAAASGIAREPLLKALVPMAEVIGGECRDARLHPLGNSGRVELRFAWGSILDRIVTPADLPEAPAGSAAFGLAETGAAAALPILNDLGECVFTPLLIAGQAGSGKSSAVWAVLHGFITLGVPVRLWVADPAGGVEMAALQDAYDDGAGTPFFRVHAYADDEASIEAMVSEMYEAMCARMAAQKTRRVRAHVPTVDEPVHLLLVDELLLLDKLLKAGKSGPLGRIQIAGRKAGFSVIACTQLAKVTDVGAVRDLFLQRLVFRTVSREATEAALGSGSGWSEKAPAHRIPRTARGVGYYVDAEGRTTASDEAIQFRSVYLRDEDVARIARGGTPLGWTPLADPLPDPLPGPIPDPGPVPDPLPGTVPVDGRPGLHLVPSDVADPSGPALPSGPGGPVGGGEVA